MVASHLYQFGCSITSKSGIVHRIPRVMASNSGEKEEEEAGKEEEAELHLVRRTQV